MELVELLMYVSNDTNNGMDHLGSITSSDDSRWIYYYDDMMLLGMDGSSVATNTQMWNGTS